MNKSLLEKLKEQLEDAKLSRKYTWNAMKAGQLDNKINRLEKEIQKLEED